jgi:hypothetical protein
MLRIVYDLIRHWTITKVYVDGSNPAFVKSFKRMIREYPDYEHISREEMHSIEFSNS